MPPIPKAAFFSDHTNTVPHVYGSGRREMIEQQTSCLPGVFNLQNFESNKEQLKEVEVIFSTWTMPVLSAEHLDAMPKLKAVFYAAGSVRYFCPPLLERGIKVISAWAANAVPVAEFTLAQILLTNKGYFQNYRQFRGPGDFKKSYIGNGNFDETVALLGAGQIGRKVIELLKPFHLRVVVFDPFLSNEKAAKLGVSKVTLEEAFAQSAVVSNHLANVPATEKLLDGKYFGSMRQNAVFINTGRGATVNEADLIRVFESRPDLIALLDVTYPEPPPEDSPLYRMPNVQLTTHIAGSAGNEVVRMADYMIEEFCAWKEDRPLRYEVTPAMMDTIA